MDKVTHYRNLVRNLLSDIAATFSKSNQWEIIEIYDEKRGHYALFTDGWKGDSRDYGCFMHLEVKEDGKIWLRRDGTDIEVGQSLLDEGVPKSDIVPAFRSPTARLYMDYAVN